MISPATFLHEALIAANIPVNTVRFTNGVLEIVYFDEATTQQRINGESIKDSFNLSDVEQNLRETNKQKNNAMSIFLTDNSIMARITRAIALVLMDEINTLRASALVGTTTATWDVPNLANGAGTTSPNLTVVGAVIGDVVDVAPPLNPAGLLIYGYVSAANTVNVRINNTTGGAINLANGSWGVAVRRPRNLTLRTTKDFKDAITAKIQAE